MTHQHKWEYDYFLGDDGKKYANLQCSICKAVKALKTEATK